MNRLDVIRIFICLLFFISNSPSAGFSGQGGSHEKIDGSSINESMMADESTKKHWLVTTKYAVEYPDPPEIIPSRSVITHNEIMPVEIILHWPEGALTERDLIVENASISALTLLEHNKYQLMIVANNNGDVTVAVKSKAFVWLDQLVVHPYNETTIKLIDVLTDSAQEYHIYGNEGDTTHVGYSYYNKPKEYTNADEIFVMDFSFNFAMNPIDNICNFATTQNMTCLSGQLSNKEMILRFKPDGHEPLGTMRFILPSGVMRIKESALLGASQLVTDLIFGGIDFSIPYRPNVNLVPVEEVPNADMDIDQNLSVYVGSTKIISEDEPSVRNGTDFGTVRIGNKEGRMIYVYNPHKRPIVIGEYQGLAEGELPNGPMVICCKEKPDIEPPYDHLNPGFKPGAGGPLIKGRDRDQFEIVLWHQLPGGLPNLRQVNVYPFEIIFKPTSTGRKTAYITMGSVNDDRSFQTFVINIVGNGEPRDDESSLSMLKITLRDQYDNYGIPSPTLHDIPEYYIKGRVITSTICKSSMNTTLPSAPEIRRHFYNIQNASIGSIYNITDHCFTFDVVPSNNGSIHYAIHQNLFYDYSHFTAAKKLGIKLRPIIITILVDEAGSASFEDHREFVIDSARQLAQSKNVQSNIDHYLNHIASLDKHTLRDKYSFNISGVGSNNNGLFYTDTNNLYGQNNGYNLWNMTKWKHYDADNANTDQVINTLGVDYDLTDNLMLGVIGQFDSYAELTYKGSAGNLEMESTGWMIGSYVVNKLKQGSSYNLFVGVGKSQNTLIYSDSEIDTYKANQLIILSSLTETIKYYDGKIKLLPYVDFEYYKENQYDFRLHDETVIESNNIVFGDIDIGFKATYDLLPTSDEGIIRLSLGLNSIGAFENYSYNETLYMKELRNQFTLGVAINNGMNNSLYVDYTKDGIMGSRFENDELKLSLRNDIYKYGFEKGSYMESNLLLDDDKEIGVKFNIAF